MDFYGYNVAAFVIILIALIYFQHKQSSNAALLAKSRGQDGAAITASKAVLQQFKWKFLPVYLLAFGADWLQGPFIYTMYKDEKGLSEETVAYLFTTGFAAAAISASLVGSLADKYGRKAATLFFCIVYSISCFTVLFDHILILFAGRVLGGLSSTLLNTVLESWMVTEYHRHCLEVAGPLKDIFGLMVTLNGGIAISAGLVAQWTADWTGSQAAPFLTSVVCLVLAFGWVSRRWNENYGHGGHDPSAATDTEGEEEALPIENEKEINGFRVIANDKRLWALCIASATFEGSMYLWIFFKFPALKLSHQEAGKGSELPFGTIFAALMCAMMLGSMLFRYYSKLSADAVDYDSTPHFWILSSSQLLTVTLFVASACFIVPVIVRHEPLTFWCFCLFEICCGIYFPSVAHLRERIVEDGVRAKVYGILRIPLNIFVVLGLALTQDGLRHRENIFIICAGAMAMAGAALGALVSE